MIQVVLGFALFMMATLSVGQAVVGPPDTNGGNVKSESSMKRKISFKRDELTLIGNLFTPENFDEKGHYPAIIVEGSFTSVKEQMPDMYAQRFAHNGFVVLAFDYSHYGESEGQPRQVESPANKLRDLEAAVSFLTSQSYIQAVGMVGVCTSAGNAAYLASDDQRIKAMATIAGFLPDPTQMIGLLGEKKIADRRQEGAAAKRKYAETGQSDEIATYSETDPSAANFNPKAGSYDYYMNPKRGGIPEWKNAFAVQCWEEWLAFDPISKASAITVPTMVVHSDGCAFPDQAKKFYFLVKGEKELVWADGTHFDYYDHPAQVDKAVKQVSRYFKDHLK